MFDVCSVVRATGLEKRRWFAVRVKSNRERLVATSLKAKGFAVCLPIYRRTTRVGVAMRECPLFPGYVFGHFDPSILLPVVAIPGVVEVVSCGRIPEPVDEVEMQSLMKIAEAGACTEPYPYLNAGESVRIGRGALEGVEGFIIRDKGQERVVISVSLLSRSVAVEVERGSVEPLYPSAFTVRALIAQRLALRSGAMGG